MDRFEEAVMNGRWDNMPPTLKNGSINMVKRLQILQSGITSVKSDNSTYDPWEITKSQLDGEELALIGRVVWTGQKM